MPFTSSFSCGAGEGYGYALGVRTRTSLDTGRGSLGEFGWDDGVIADKTIFCDNLEGKMTFTVDASFATFDVS